MGVNGQPAPMDAPAPIRIVPPFPSIDGGMVMKYLLEDGLTMRFSWKKRAYYDLVRPFLPVALRQRIQKAYAADIRCRPDFIDDGLVRQVLERGRTGTPPEGVYPGGARCAVVLTHDVETGTGLAAVPTVIDLEAKYGFRSSWNIVPHKYPIDDGIVGLIRESGHEIGIHGYNHDGRLYYSERIFDARARAINDALKRYGAVGFRSPMVHRNLVWLQKLEILYDASCFDYDPYQPFPGGTGCIWPFIAGRFVELPYTLPQDHTLFHVLGHRTPDVWIRKTEWLASMGGMILALTHPDYLIRRDHMALYEEFLRYLASLDGAWRCLPMEMAQWWRRRNGIPAAETGSVPAD